MTEGGYVVEVKPSARRTNGAVGRLVAREGPRHVFVGRPAADAWAHDLAAAGDRHVWVQDAHPADDAPVDGYLVGRYGRHELDGAREAEAPPGAGLGAFEPRP